MRSEVPAIDLRSWTVVRTLITMDEFWKGGWGAKGCHGKWVRSEWRPERTCGKRLWGEIYHWALPSLYFWPVEPVDHFRELSQGMGEPRHMCVYSLSLLKNDFIYFIFGCAGSLLLPGIFSSCGEQGLLSCCRAWALGFAGFRRCSRQAQ